MVSLTDEQNAVKRKILNWFSKSRGKLDICALAGYAGTGKTTLMTHIAAELPSYSIGFLAPTGKAASVLRDKLTRDQVLSDTSSVSTIHSYVYNCNGRDEDDELIFTDKEADEIFEHDLIIVDEASMVKKEELTALVNLNKPLLFVGDPWQLPPVKSEPFLPLMQTDIVLKTVHRQALDNPIVRCATNLRNGMDVPYGNYDGVFSYSKIPYFTKLYPMFKQFATRDIGFICSRHKERLLVNQTVRMLMGYRGLLPNPGETLMCLSNDNNYKLYNGMQVVAEQVDPLDEANKCYMVKLKGYPLPVISYSGGLGRKDSDNVEKLYKVDMPYIRRVRARFDLPKYWLPYNLDYGYGMTVHKSQGSEWDNVALFLHTLREQPLEDYKRMVYTGMTRAKKKLLMFNMEGINKLCTAQR